LVRLLKSRILGLTAIQKSRAKQKSRLTWLRLGDANTKYFHLMANARKKKNHIHTLTTDNGVAVSEAKKQSVIHEILLSTLDPTSLEVML
jgi:hypothetical protein